MRLRRVLANGLSLALLVLAFFPSFAQSRPAFVHKKKYAMGTVFEIAAYGESSALLSNAIDRAFAEIVRLDDLLSDYKPDSALSHLNRSAFKQPQSVPPELYQVIEKSLRYSRMSEGKFDVTVAPLVKAWKAALRGERAPTAEEEKKLRACIGYQKIELLAPRRIRFHSPCLQIDLGSIGKGYALDRAAAILRAHGIASALLDAGGSSLYAIGAPPGHAGWLVHLRDPSSKLGPEIMLSDSSVSTSEQSPPSLLAGGESAGHIVDPATGKPIPTGFTLSVVAPTASASDALSTTLLLLGPERGAGLAKAQREVAAIWISAAGETKLASSGPQIVFTGAGLASGASAEPGGHRR